jgi:hypothetical protein
LLARPIADGLKIEVIDLEHVESKQASTDTGRQEDAKLGDNLPQIGELIKSALINPGLGHSPVTRFVAR